MVSYEATYSIKIFCARIIIFYVVVAKGACVNAHYVGGTMLVRCFIRLGRRMQAAMNICDIFMYFQNSSLGYLQNVQSVSV